MWYTGEGWGWWMMMGGVWMIVFWGVIIWAVSTLVRRFDGEERRPPTESGALAVLERRYANGELSHEEFEEMRRRLSRPDAR